MPPPRAIKGVGRFQRAPARTYAPPVKGVSLKPKAIQSGIAQAVERAMNQILEEMYAVAEAKVPVRKIFKGGRRKLRFATKAETEEARRIVSNLGGEPKFATIPPGLKRNPSSGLGKRFYRIVEDTSPLTRTYHTRSGEARTILFAKKRTGRNRANDAPPWDDRELTEPASTNPGRLSDAAEARLTKRGRAYVRAREGQSGVYLGGNLKHSIRVEHARIESAGSRIRLVGKLVAGGERAPYAQFVELGTSRMPAQPFLRPALHGAETLFRARIAAEIKKGIYLTSAGPDKASSLEDNAVRSFLESIKRM